MFKEIITSILMVTYTTNIFSVAFLGAILNLYTDDVEAAPTQPVAFEYSCPAGNDMIGGVCMKTELTSLVETCEPGYSRNGNTDDCFKDEVVNATPICGSGYTYNSSLFPELCSVSVAKPNSYSASCPSGFNTEINGRCYKTQAPASWSCPANASNAAPQTILQQCGDITRALGLCSGTSSVTTPDQRWNFRDSNKSCKRKLWVGLDRYCPSGYEYDGSDCKKLTQSSPVRSCPTGSYEQDNRCIQGSSPSCPTNTTFSNGSCVAPNGDVSCPTGSYLEQSSGVCVANRVDSQPTTWTSSDFDSFYDQGASFGSAVSQTVSIPSVSANGTLSVTPTFLDHSASVSDPSVFSALKATGVDSNNSYQNPNDAYQNENKQTEFVKDRIESNTQFIENASSVAGDTHQEQVDNTDHAALAYGALIDSRNTNPPRKISREDGIFASGQLAVGEAFTGTGKYFSDCSDSTVTYEEFDESKVIKTQKHCFKPNKNNYSGCVLERHPISPTLAIIEGMEDSRVTQCGTNCLTFTLGKELNNNLVQTGQCGIYEKKVKVKLKSGYHVTKATLKRTHYDDHFRVYADNYLLFDGVQGTFNTPDGFPTEFTSCERSTSIDIYNHQDVTTQFENALQNDNDIEFTYKIGVGGYGEAYAKVDVIFDKPISTQWSEEIVAFPEGCQDNLDVPSTYCSDEGWECTKKFTSSDDKFDVINVSDGSNGEGKGNTASLDDALILVAKRKFDVSNDQSQNCGIVAGTTWNAANGNEENGVYFCGDKAGIGTDSNSVIIGTELTNLLPNKDEWVVMAIRTERDRADWFKVEQNGVVTKYNSRRLQGGRFENFKVSGYRVARSISSSDWHNTANGDLLFGYWDVLDSPTDEEIESKLMDLNFKQPWLYYGELFPDDPGDPICMEAEAKSYICDPLKGRKITFDNDDFSFKEIINMDDSCSVNDEDDTCSVTGQTCVDGFMDDITGTCYAWNVDYECQDTSNAFVTRTESNDTCMTDISCIDGSCDVIADEENQDFTEALTTYAVMNEIGNQKNCTGDGTTDSCTVFDGEARYCSWDQLKINDCCEQPSGTDTMSVFKFGLNFATVEGYMASGTGAFADTGIQTGLESIHGAVGEVWTDMTSTVTDAASSAWTNVSGAFTSATSNAAGNTTGSILTEAGTSVGNFFSDASAALSGFKSEMMNGIYDLLPDMMQQAIKDAVVSLGSSTGQQAGGSAVEFIAGQVAAFISFVSWVYAAYQLANLAYTMLTACEEEEMDMGNMLLGKKCFFTNHVPCSKTFGVCTNKAKDEYCCYESVLSRIIMEQATTQLGWDKKDFRDTMGCRGLTITEIGTIDFGLIDFSEWIDLMAQSGMLPDGESMDSVTGGNLANPYNRSNTLDRMNDRSNDSNIWVDRMKEIEEGDVINNVDCNSRPRPQSCEVGTLK